MEGEVFIIDHTVRSAQGTAMPNPEDDDILSLVDADGASCQPNRYLYTNYNHRILLTSSPRGRDDRKWLTQRARDQHAVFVMEPWLREEIVVALFVYSAWLVRLLTMYRLFLESTDITLKRFREASHICGNIPRQCFEAAVSPAALRDATSEIKLAIKQTGKLSDAVINVNDGGTIHRAFQIRPSEDRFWASCLVEPVSDWALLEMMAELGRRNANGAYEFYCAIQGSPNSSALGGIMFENKLHPFLQAMATPRTFTIQSLDDRSNTLDITFSSNTQHLTFGADQRFSGQLASSVGSNKSCYLKPLSRVFPSFDSFLYQSDMSQSSFSPLIALQVTTAATHDISITGLEKIQKSLKPKIADLKNLRPTKARKMIILFVVPDTMGAAFVTQKITGAKKMGHWDKKTAQYVLMLSEKEVFRAT
jgi:hypothetical protein